MVKKTVKEQFKDLDMMVGNGQVIDSFTDKKSRVIHPIPLKNFSDFMENISIINFEKLWVNFLQEESTKAVTKVIEMSFKDEKLNALMEVINAKNYPEIIKKIIALNGIEINDKPSAGKGSSDTQGE